MKHPYIPCIEPRSRALAEAIENYEIPCGWEDGEPAHDNRAVGKERRHVKGRDLKVWLEKNFPNEKPEFLFDDIERSTHTAISADAYRTLKAENEAMTIRLKNAEAEYKKLREEKKTIEAAYNQLTAQAGNAQALGPRSEGTYQNIIAALLEYIKGTIPDISLHPSFVNEAQLIAALAKHFDGYGGLSESTLNRKIPQARNNLSNS